MDIYKEIDDRFKTALKQKDRVALDALRGLKTAIKNKEVELKRKLNEQELIQLVAKQIRQREDAIEQYKKGNRPELADKEQKEKEVLAAFMPPPITDEELEKIVFQVIKEVGAKGPKDMGKVMKEIMPQVAGRADGKKVSELVKKYLTS